MAVSTVAGLILLVAPTAIGADTSSAGTAIPAGAIEADMFVMSIDDNAAALAGNVVTTDGREKMLTDGRTGEEIARVPLSSPLSQPRPGGPQPYNTVQGNCGSSYFYMADLPGEEYEFWTGFNVDGSAYDFDWFVTVRGEYENGVDSLEWEDSGPQYPGPEWTSGLVKDTAYSPDGTYYYGRVMSGAAYLTDGRVCYSGNPNAGTVLYNS